MTMTKQLSPNWVFVADTVMGGVSTGSVTATSIKERAAHRLTGHVSLENDGGFVQMAFDLTGDIAVDDAGDWTGLELDVTGNNETYEVRLRTSQLTKPWQSFRAEFQASEGWKTVRMPFDGFEAYRHEFSFDPNQLRRIGVLAVGREFQADVAVSAIRLYR
ncbi:complex I intermediate-associated protein 30 (CIA30) [Hoeflea halophila]|uniref:Complex I intermediate-associated protein 30 (CIA30) n=1 Tax=Hoeflea halophila TaxID=714899 RepID=A0A286IHZ8_9HYPH|nr:CIA30 family protein [Hoeflea halophila]SOE18999.1 complex I intermediate-associated protein 30 (CIA30) [Hoeflea halophila]